MSLNNYQIKLLASILMVIDHVGVVFFPEVAIFRLIGRFSFPLFIWLLVQGERYTRNFQQYCFRLLLLGIISQPIYQILFNSTQLNILFTLLLGLLCLRLSRKFSQIQPLIWLVSGAIAQLMNLEYSAYGIVAIVLTRYFQPSPIWWLGWIALHLSTFLLQPQFAPLQFPAILAPLLFQMANQQRGKRGRWFYLFYPTHLLVLWFLRRAV